MMSDTNTRKKPLDLKLVPFATGKIKYFQQVQFNPLDFIHSKETLVGIFDYLGFKKLMSRPDLFEIASDIISVSNAVKDCGKEYKNIFEINGKSSNLSPGVFQISDTIIVYNLSREAPNIKHFLWNVHNMMFYSILAGFPLRGALTTGEILIKKDLSLFLGGALQEAFELERQQNWSGACIGPSLEQYLNEIDMLESLFPQILPYTIPFKEGTFINHGKRPKMAINWIDDFNWIRPDYIKEKFPPFEPNSHEEQIVANTSDFLEFANRNIAKCKHSWGPTKRKITLRPAPDLGGSIININDDDDDDDDDFGYSK